MRGSTATAVAAFVIAMLLGTLSSQPSPNCPYGGGLPSEVCQNNSQSDPISPSLGGSRMAPAKCARTLIDALAAMFSYDDWACHALGSNVSIDLKYVSDALDSLPDYYKGSQRAAIFAEVFFVTVRQIR